MCMFDQCGRDHCSIIVDHVFMIYQVCTAQGYFSSLPEAYDRGFRKNSSSSEL